MVLATSTKKEDRVLKKVADSLGVPAFFGSLNDVLSRFYHAAKKYRLDAIVRVTADCPLIDPVIVDEVIEKFIEGGFDFYELCGEFPDGLDVSIVSFNALEHAFKNAKMPSDREHVAALFFRSAKNGLKAGGYEKFKEKGGYRWTLDEPRDYEFLQRVFAELYKESGEFYYQDVFDLLERKPELAEINSGIIRNEGLLKSLEEDRRYKTKMGITL